MGLQSEIQELMAERGETVRPWGQIAPGRFVVVRPAGIVEQRSIVEVWLINESHVPDPDVGMDQWTEDTYAALRFAMLDVTAPAGPPYDPTGKAARSTMVFSGASRYVAGLGES